MAFNHRKMLVSYCEDCVFRGPITYIPVKKLNVTIYIPCFQFQTYPPPPPPPPPQRDLSLLVSTLICILGSVLLFLFLVIILYLYIMQSRRSSAAAVAPGDTNGREDENEAGERDISGDHHVWRTTTAGLHRSAIDSITVVGFKKGEGIIDGTECSVCLNEFEEDESLRLLPKCSHAFHINCIDTWLLSHKNCPLCRAPILLTEPCNQETEISHVSESGSSNDPSVEEVGPGSRNRGFLSRAQSDLANHCGSGSLETVRRSFSIGGSSSLKAGDSDDIATRSGRHFYSSFSANFFTSSRRSRNQDPVFPNRMPSLSG